MLRINWPKLLDFINQLCSFGAIISYVADSFPCSLRRKLQITTHTTGV